MILATRGQDVVVRAADFSNTSIIPPAGTSTGPLAWASRLVRDDDAFGLVAVAACIRLLSGQIAGMPFGAYSGAGAERQPATSSWQWELLHEMPSPDWDSFRFMEAVVSSLESTANAFIEKVMPSRARAGRPRVVELRPMDPDYVQVKVRDGKKRIYWWDGGKTTEVTSRVLHIPGWAPKPSPVGRSVIRLHGAALQKSISLEEYQGRYFQNDARPSVVLSVPGTPTKDQRVAMREGFAADHAGSGQSHGVGVMWGGATLQTIGSALRDTQAVELVNAAVDEAARMYQIPAKMVGGGLSQRATPETPEAEFTRFFRISLFPRTRRIERAFSTDQDLFGGSGLHSRLDPAEMLRADTATTATVIHELIQVGAISPNEGRAWLGLPPIPGGDVVQATPVGGAPNSDPPARRPVGVVMRTETANPAAG